MSVPLDTLQLDPTTWDLTVDANGNIAVATPPYAVAQDVASAVKTYLGEVWYDTTIGIPYSAILGKFISLAYLKAQLVNAALTVPGVKAAAAYLSDLSNRTLSGQIQVTTVTGQTFPVSF